MLPENIEIPQPSEPIDVYLPPDEEGKEIFEFRRIRLNQSYSNPSMERNSILMEAVAQSEEGYNREQENNAPYNEMDFSLRSIERNVLPVLFAERSNDEESILDQPYAFEPGN
jgi:hypothetical protein